MQGGRGTKQTTVYETHEKPTMTTITAMTTNQNKTKQIKNQTKKTERKTNKQTNQHTITATLNR